MSLFWTIYFILEIINDLSKNVKKNFSSCFQKIILDFEALIRYNMRMKLRWTEKERNTLRTYYGTISMEELLEKLPGRNANSIYKQVNYLRKRGWTFGKQTT